MTGHEGPLTLAFDIGGSHLKAGLLSAKGAMLKGPNRVVTPHPSVPDRVVEELTGLAGATGAYDRVTIGFPGVVRDDYVLTAPNLGTELWQGFQARRSDPRSAEKNRCVCLTMRACKVSAPFPDRAWSARSHWGQASASRSSATEPSPRI